MKKQLKNIITGKIMEQGEFDFDWQEFVLERMESFEDESGDIESGFVGYNNGFLDGFRLALVLVKSRRGGVLR